MRRFLVLLPFCVLILYAQNIDKASRIGYESIQPVDLKKHLSVLASDSLEGRETSFPGQKNAAQYIAGIFKKLELKPSGDDSTYFQHFDVVVSRVSPESKIVINTGGMKKNFVWGTDFLTERAIDTTITGPAAFVGFTDTELDSATQTKLAGRVVFAFIGKKDYANDTTKSAASWRLRSNRKDPGAIAALMIPDEEGSATYRQAQHMTRDFDSNNGIFRLISDRTQMQLASPHFLVIPALAEEVLKSTGKSLKQLRNEALQNQEFTPIFIDDAVITIHTKIINETKQTENVLGIIAGSDPDLKKQFVAFTAHYDHIGKDEAGIIYHGADDDGSGTAGVLELAEAFESNPVKPKRSLLFLMTAGEEKGLLGSKFYASNPVIPFKQIIADLNMDMIGRNEEVQAGADARFRGLEVQTAESNNNALNVLGAHRSADLRSETEKANRAYGLELKFRYDNNLSNLLRRSDHWPFMQKGQWSVETTWRS